MDGHPAVGVVAATPGDLGWANGDAIDLVSVFWSLGHILIKQEYSIISTVFYHLFDSTAASKSPL
jgi:hypothetical protein